MAWNGHREEIWRSDGTPQGTFPVPGAELDTTRQLASSAFTQVGSLQFFTVARSRANSSVSDAELWRTDGTGSGTRGVASFAGRASLDFLTPWGAKLLLLVEKTTADCTLWSSDGTAEGTRMILPVVPGRRCLTALTVLDGSRFFFVARVERSGGPVPQVFISDGTPEGTRQISALHGSREPLDHDSLVVIDGVAYLRILGRLYDGEVELWRSDGTPAGTFRIFKNLAEAGDLFGLRGALYFTASTEPLGSRHLYRTAARGVGPPIALAQSAPPDSFAEMQFTPANDRLFFTGWDADAGTDLWVTDGTPAGTRRVDNPGSRSSFPENLVAAGGRVFFSGDDGEHGRELWESDGTPGGTRMVSDLNPGGFSSDPKNLVVSGNYLFFSADDGETGTEPWALRLEP
jgi:ELWxxDGT repeat protein